MHERSSGSQYLKIVKHDKSACIVQFTFTARLCRTFGSMLQLEVRDQHFERYILSR